ncbi:dTDP-4-dehydrorhamnose reductase [bacterium]|nr:dTDP-4-dehydrorhamnose reductase [bacterium]
MSASKKVLVTGAKGMLGQDLCPIFEDEGFEVVETDRDNLDITDENRVETVLNTEKPDYILHLAGYTNVDGAESDLETARLINSKGTENIAKMAQKINAAMVYISTDYVFDGEKQEPYLPTDTPNPQSNYGLTKFEGEQAVQKYCEKYYITRTSWLYGIHGKNFVETILSLKGDIKVVDDQIGCPTWTVDLANAILKIIKDEKPYGIYHTCGGGYTSWYGFAKEFGAKCNPCTTKEFPRPAKRPKYSVMDNGKLLRNWKLALKDYMNLREV